MEVEQLQRLEEKGKREIKEILQKWQGHKKALVPDFYEIPEMVKGKKTAVFVAMVRERGEKRIVGLANAELLTGAGHILNVVVHPEFKEKGVGTKLFAQAEDWLRNKGVRKIYAYGGLMGVKLLKKFKYWNDKSQPEGRSYFVKHL